MPRETGNHGKRVRKYSHSKTRLITAFHRKFTVSLLASFRLALLTCAALTASTIAPAQAGPTGETLVSVASATLATPSVPDLLDPNGETQLSQPNADIQETPTDNQDNDELAQPDIDRSEDLA